MPQAVLASPRLFWLDVLCVGFFFFLSQRRDVNCAERNTSSATTDSFSHRFFISAFLIQFKSAFIVQLNNWPAGQNAVVPATPFSIPLGFFSAAFLSAMSTLYMPYSLTITQRTNKRFLLLTELQREGCAVR